MGDPIGGRRRDPTEPGDEAGGWTLLDDGWWGRGPIEGGGWRQVLPPGERPGGRGLSDWTIEHWRELTADLLQLYGVDVGDQVLLRARPWSWLSALIEGCMTARSRTLWSQVGHEGRERARKALAEGGDVTPWL